MHADASKYKRRGDHALKLITLEEQEVSLHISLSDIEPLIWRRLQVSDAIDLHALHLIIQAAFGWRNAHRHSFIIRQGEVYSSGDPDFDCPGEDESHDSRRIQLRDLWQRSIKSFRYVYDLGDNWLHRIRMESVGSQTRETLTPLCVDGARHAPPEDCGGSLGYEELRDAWLDPRHPVHAEARRRLRPGFDPEAFDRHRANARLKKMLNGQML